MQPIDKEASLKKKNNNLSLKDPKHFVISILYFQCGLRLSYPTASPECFLSTRKCECKGSCPELCSEPLHGIIV